MSSSGRPVLVTLDFVATAMLALAVATGLAGLIVGGLLIFRTVTRAADETAELRSLGMTGTARGRAVTAAAVPSALGAAALTLIVAVASSALVPFGLAGKAEPDPGLRFDTAVVLIGAAVTCVLVLAIVALAAMRTMRRAAGAGHTPPYRTRSRLAELGLPVGPLCGLDLVLGSGRRGRGVNQAAVVGTALAAMAGAGALVLTASTDHLFATPRHVRLDLGLHRSGGGRRAPRRRPRRRVGRDRASGTSHHRRPGDDHPGDQLAQGGASPAARRRAARRAGRGRARDADDGRPRRRSSATPSWPTARIWRTRSCGWSGAAVFAGVIDVPEAGRGAAMPLEELTRLGLFGEEGDPTGVIDLAAGADREAFARRITEETGERARVGPSNPSS